MLALAHAPARSQRHAPSCWCIVVPRRVLTDPVVGSLRAENLTRRLKWEDNPPLATMTDVLRVHEYAYVHRILEACGDAHPDGAATPGSPLTRAKPTPEAAADSQQAKHDIKLIDTDTAVSAGTFRAALRAAGAMLRAVDAVCKGEAHHAFCAVRPPGHHAGPQGLVTCPNDPDGSHGFCIFNNVAVGAAYVACAARCIVARCAMCRVSRWL